MAAVCKIGGAVLAPIADCVGPPHRHRQHVNTTKPQSKSRFVELTAGVAGRSE